MNSEAKKKQDVIKITHKNQSKQKSKLVDGKHLSYAQVSGKIITTFDLQKQKHYRLYYQDQENQQINVNTQEDYQVFVKSVQHFKLYLEDTTDLDQDFRKNLQKGQVQTSQLQQTLVKQEDQPQKLEHKSQNNSIKKKIQIEQLKQHFHQVIEDRRKQMQIQLQDFKKDLESRTKTQMNDGLNQLKAQLEEAQQNSIKLENEKRSKNFKETIGCQSPIKCQGKEAIIGYRHKCIVCSIYVCENCSHQEFKTKDSTHSPDHPLVQFRSDKLSWQNITEIILADLPKKELISQAQKSRLADLELKIGKVVQFSNKSQQQVRNLVSNYPDLSEQELLEKALEL